MRASGAKISLLSSSQSAHQYSFCPNNVIIALSYQISTIFWYTMFATILSISSLSSSSPPSLPQALSWRHNKDNLINNTNEDILRAIHEIGTTCSTKKSSANSDVIIPMSDSAIFQLTKPFTNKSQYEQTRNSIELLSRIISIYNNAHSDYDMMIRNLLDEMMRMDNNIFRLRVAIFDWSSLEESATQNGNHEIKCRYFESYKKKEIHGAVNKLLKLDEPWLPKSFKDILKSKHKDSFDDRLINEWTNAYFNCQLKIWLISYTAFMVTVTASSQEPPKILGLISADIDVNKTDINQCDSSVNQKEYSFANVVLSLAGTHKCDRHTSDCKFVSGKGWVRGAYECFCKRGYYSAVIFGDPFNGSEVEEAWYDKKDRGSLSYDYMYVCQKCAEGCDSCHNSNPCLSSYNWAFRISLLTITILCIILTLILIFYIYRYRKMKVIKVASPIFLGITLLGCAIMYSETAAIFPVLDVYFCILTKWTRHMGFCVTYSALLLKTWRVSLTYRVKSAHKLKLTDKQLLQWLFPILLVMAIYLGTWTISASPEAIYLVDWNGLKFKLCEYNWWDHSLVIGELLFLLWGIKVCYNVRNAESFFNEAKYITWAIYNIALVNMIMIFIHLLILPTAGPDIKYFFGFVRTQMSTTTTIILIFGPKFYRVVKGQGDNWDNRVRARGVAASFSLNGVGLVHEETTDLYQENEELKEEIQKLASQMEIMKICQMEFKNRHLPKPKHFTTLSTKENIVNIATNPVAAGSTQSPIVKAIYSRFDTTEPSPQKISPNAELLSEKV